MFLAEFLGTMILVFLGTATCAAVTLEKSSAKGSGWVFIAIGWGFAVLAGALISIPISGGHLNPAVSLAFLITGDLAFTEFLMYIFAQLLGAFVGAYLTYQVYLDHFNANESGDLAGIFCTGATFKNLGRNIFVEALGTFILVFFILATTMYDALGPVYVPLVVIGIGIGFGNVTGYAINPARDFAPRLMYSLLVNHKNKVAADWGYAVVPIIGPLLGGFIAATVFVQFY